jgi:hypothetical protein
MTGLDQEVRFLQPPEHVPEHAPWQSFEQLDEHPEQPPLVEPPVHELHEVDAVEPPVHVVQAAPVEPPLQLVHDVLLVDVPSQVPVHVPVQVSWQSPVEPSPPQAATSRDSAPIPPR